MSIRSVVSLLQTWLHKPYNTGLPSLNQLFLLSSHVQHFKLKIQKTPSRQTSSFLSKEHKKQLPQRAKTQFTSTELPTQKQKEAQQVGSDVSRGPKLYQSTWCKLQTLYMHMSNWTRDPETIYLLAAWIISSRIINKQTLSSPWALIFTSFFGGLNQLIFSLKWWHVSLALIFATFWS